NVERWERSVQDEEDALEQLKLAEARYRKEIDEDKEKIEALKHKKNSKKTGIDEMEEEIAKARKEVANLAKEIHSIGSICAGIEAKIESKKNERHNLLLQAKMDCIQIPLVKGSLDDACQSQNESGNTSSMVSESENKIEVDYRLLGRDKRDENTYKKTNDHLQKDLQA
uniref:Uncharacterized protein n=1 Tax=Megaselia scalaris TaxID=36166 RepID=T1GHG7_MEGSC